MAEVPSTQIVTLTINPAVDISTSVKKMQPFTKMRCAQAHRDPGGGGINVARVLKRLGDRNLSGWRRHRAVPFGAG